MEEACVCGLSLTATNCPRSLLVVVVVIVIIVASKLVTEVVIAFMWPQVRRNGAAAATSNQLFQFVLGNLFEPPDASQRCSGLNAVTSEEGTILMLNHISEFKVHITILLQSITPNA
jgi:hypothetical protein